VDHLFTFVLLCDFVAMTGHVTAQTSVVCNATVLDGVCLDPFEFADLFAGYHNYTAKEYNSACK